MGRKCGGWGRALESTILCIECESISGRGFETLRADVPLQNVAEAAVRCAALGRPEV